MVSACDGHISVSIISASDRRWPPTLSSSCLSPAATKLEHTATFSTTSPLNNTTRNFDAPALMSMTLQPQRPAVTLTFHPQNLIRSSVGASEYILSVSSRLLKPFTRYRGNNICPDKQTNAADGQPEKQWISRHCRRAKTSRWRRNSHRLMPTARELMPFSCALSHRGLLDPSKPAYNVEWMDGSVRRHRL